MVIFEIASYSGWEACRHMAEERNIHFKEKKVSSTQLLAATKFALDVRYVKFVAQ